MDFKPYEHLLDAISAEWLQAETDIKQAEQVCEEVVTPSVFELRYAGRRVVEAIRLSIAGADPAEVEDTLRDARLDCHRARHDAVDAAAAKIAKDIEVMNSVLGQDIVLRAFPNLATLRRALQDVRNGIVSARGDLAGRDRIYAEIETRGFPHLVELYRELQLAEQDMIALKRRQRRVKLGGGLLGWSALLVGIVDVLLHVFDVHFRFGPG